MIALNHISQFQLSPNHYYSITIVLLIHFFLNFKYKNNFLLFVYNLLGVTLHELSHFIVSLFLNGKPNFINVIPNKRIKSLGSVKVNNVTYYNKLFIGLSPISLIVLSYYVFVDHFLVENVFTKQVLLFYIAFIIFIHSMPSKQDLRIAFL